jgi:hypothetical protein
MQRGRGWVPVDGVLVLHCVAGCLGEPGAFSGDDDPLARGQVGDGGDEPTKGTGSLV